MNARPCTKSQGWTDRLAAREYLLGLWAKGDMRWQGTHWCDHHRQWHMTRSKPSAGRNHAYHDGRVK